MSEQDGAPTDQAAVTESTVTSTEAPAAPAVPESLDDVYARFNVQAVTPTPEPPAPQSPAPPAQPAYSPPPAPAAKPDFYGVDPYGEHQPSVEQRWQNELQALDARFAALEQRERQATEQAHIEAQNRAGNAAVERVMNVIGDGADERLVKGELAILLAEDAKFRALFEGRDQNPEALDAALTAIGENRKRALVREIDPQTVEDQRAAQAAFSTTEGGPSGSTEAPPSVRMNNREFDNYWNSFRS